VKSKIIFILVSLIIFSSGVFSAPPTCKEIVLKMISAIKNVEGLKYNLKITERTEGKYNNFSSSVKLKRNPRKLYLSTNGIEVLWTQGTNKGDALVKPNSFPFFNLNLDPMGSLMRDGQHHTINEMGFDYFGNVIAHNVLKSGDQFDKLFKYEGEEFVNGRFCYKFSINNSDFKFIDYTVGKGENLITIARKLHVSEYMILENNKKVDDYKDVKIGQVIKVPTAYAKYVLIYVDKQTFLPTGSRIFDNIGLYEQYDYSNLQLNPKFEDEEFTKNYKGYGF
jgi:outer membrane lipoprotein-sorting protein